MSSPNQPTKMTTTKSQAQETTAKTLSVDTTIAVTSTYILAENGMKFALNPTTPPPAKDLPYAFTHVDGKGVKTTTVFERPIVGGTEHEQKEKKDGKVVVKKETPGATRHEQDVHPNERVLVLRKRAVGYRGRGGKRGGGTQH